MSKPPSAARPRTSAGRPPSAIGPARVPAQQRQGSAMPAGRPRTTFGAGGGAAAQGGRPPSSLGGGGARPASSMGGARPGSSMSMAAGQFFNSLDDAARTGTGLARPASVKRGGGRIGTAAAGNRPGSRLGTAAGAGRVGGQMNVANRPMTQQGLAGARPASGLRTRGTTGRQVLDKSYYIGLIRGKMNELANEIDRMTMTIEKNNEQRQNLNVYEKKAEELALELKGYQGDLADLNLLVDKMNTNSDLGDLQSDLRQLKERNDIEAGDLDALFSDRRQKEDRAKQLEMEMDNEKRDSENFLNNMDSSLRDRYSELKERNQQLNDDLHMLEQELGQLNEKTNDLEDELTGSSLKQEAMIIHGRLSELEQKKAKIEEEMKAEGTIEEKRERIMEKVKKDNEEITAINQQVAEHKEKVDQCNEELRELDEELEGQQGEKNEKYRELRQKEVQIDDFLKSYDYNREEEQARVDRLTRNVAKTLSVIARNVAQHDKTAVMASMNEYDLGDVASGPRKPLPDNASVAQLQEMHVALQEELLRVAETQGKARDEVDGLEMKIVEMQQDAVRFADIDGLKKNAEHKRETLLKDKTELEAVLSTAQEKSGQMRTQVSQLRSKLAENDTNMQIVSLEKKLQYVEQNNFALRETIKTRNSETNIAPVREQVMEMVSEYNNLLIATTANRAGSAVTRQPQ